MVRGRGDMVGGKKKVLFVTPKYEGAYDPRNAQKGPNRIDNLLHRMYGEHQIQIVIKPILVEGSDAFCLQLVMFEVRTERSFHS